MLSADRMDAEFLSADLYSAGALKRLTALIPNDYVPAKLTSALQTPAAEPADDSDCRNRLADVMESLTVDVLRGESGSAEHDAQRYVISKIHAAIQRQINRDASDVKERTITDTKKYLSKSNALALTAGGGSRAAAGGAVSISAIALEAVVPTVILLLDSVRRHDPVIVTSIVGILNAVLRKLPPQSLTAENGFTPEITAGIEPIFAFFRTLLSERNINQRITAGSAAAASTALTTATSGGTPSTAALALDDALARKMTAAMLGLALARGSVRELLGVADSLLSRAASQSAADLGEHLEALCRINPSNSPVAPPSSSAAAAVAASVPVAVPVNPNLVHTPELGPRRGPMPGVVVPPLAIPQSPRLRPLSMPRSEPDSMPYPFLHSSSLGTAARASPRVTLNASHPSRMLGSESPPRPQFAQLYQQQPQQPMYYSHTNASPPSPVRRVVSGGGGGAAAGGSGPRRARATSPPQHGRSRSPVASPQYSPSTPPELERTYSGPMPAAPIRNPYETYDPLDALRTTASANPQPFLARANSGGYRPDPNVQRAHTPPDMRPRLVLNAQPGRQASPPMHQQRGGGDDDEEDAGLRMAMEESRIMAEMAAAKQKIAAATAALEEAKAAAAATAAAPPAATNSASGATPIVWNTTPAPSISIARTAGQSRMAALAARLEATKARSTGTATTAAAVTVSRRDEKDGKASNSGKLQTGKEERDQKGAERFVLTAQQTVDRFSSELNSNGLTAHTAALMIVSQLDRTGEAAVAAGLGGDSVGHKRPARVYLTSADGFRRVTADNSNDQRVRVLSDPLAPLQPNEIFECRWITDTKFHLVYNNRHYYANSPASESTSDVSAMRYEERKREDAADWDRAFSFQLVQPPVQYRDRLPASNRNGDTCILINEQYFAFQSDARDRMRLSRVPSALACFNLNDASLPIKENIAIAAKPKRDENAGSVPFALELHDETFTLLHTIIVQSLSPRNGGSADQLTLYLSTAAAAIRVLRRHLTPIARAAPVVRSQLLPDATHTRLFTLLSVTIPELLSAPTAASAHVPVPFTDEQQRTVWRANASQFDQFCTLAIDAGFDIFFPSNTGQLNRFGELFEKIPRTAGGGAVGDAKSRADFGLTAHEHALFTLLGVRWQDLPPHLRLMTELESDSLSEAVRASKFDAVQRVICGMIERSVASSSGGVQVLARFQSHRVLSNFQRALLSRVDHYARRNDSATASIRACLFAFTLDYTRLLFDAARRSLTQTKQSVWSPASGMSEISFVTFNDLGTSMRDESIIGRLVRPLVLTLTSALQPHTQPFAARLLSILTPFARDVCAFEPVIARALQTVAPRDSAKLFAENQTALDSLPSGLADDGSSSASPPPQPATLASLAVPYFKARVSIDAAIAAFDAAGYPATGLLTSLIDLWKRFDPHHTGLLSQYTYTAAVGSSVADWETFVTTRCRQPATTQTLDLFSVIKAQFGSRQPPDDLVHRIRARFTVLNGRPMDEQIAACGFGWLLRPFVYSLSWLSARCIGLLVASPVVAAPYAQPASAAAPAPFNVLAGREAISRLTREQKGEFARDSMTREWLSAAAESGMTQDRVHEILEQKLMEYAIARLPAAEQKAAAPPAAPITAASLESSRKTDSVLKSVLFSGGLSSGSYSAPTQRLQTELGLSTPSEPLPSESTEESAFLSALMDGPSGGGAIVTSPGRETPQQLVTLLVKSLDRSVPAHVHSLQASLQPLAQSLVCAVFAVFLKHARAGTNLVRLALQTARSAAVAGSTVPLPDRLLQKLWIRASQIKGLLREKRGNGADVELFAEHVMAKMELLLSLSSPPLSNENRIGGLIVPSPSPPPAAGDAKSPPAATALRGAALKPGSKWFRARALIHTMLRAVKAVDNLKRLMDSRDRLSADLSRWSVSLREFDFVSAVIAFYTDETVDALTVRDALIEQRDRALLRLYALQQISIQLTFLRTSAHAVPLFVHLSDAIHRSAAYSASAVLSVASVSSAGSGAASETAHFLDQLPAVGPGYTRALSDAYFGLVVSLVRTSSFSMAPALVQACVLATVNIHLSANDLIALTRSGVSIVDFIQPLISLVGTRIPNDVELQKLHLLEPRANAADSKSDSKGRYVPPEPLFTSPFHVRYAAFCLFRIMSYVYAASPANPIDAPPAVAPVNPMSVLLPAAEQKTGVVSPLAVTASPQSMQSLQSALLDSMYHSLLSISDLKFGYRVPDSSRFNRSEPSRSLLHLLESDHGWYAHEYHLSQFNLKAVAAVPPPEPPTAQELAMYSNQFWWILLRCCAAHPTGPLRRAIANDPKWVDLLLRGAGLSGNSFFDSPQFDAPPQLLAAGVPAPTTTLTRVLCSSILTHVLPIVRTTSDQVEAIVTRLLDAIGDSSLPAAPAVPKPLKSFPRSDLVFLYRTLLNGSPAAETAVAAALLPLSTPVSRTLSGSGTDPKPLSRQSSHDEKKSADAPAAAAAPSLVRVMSDYRSGAVPAPRDTATETADRACARVWGTAADTAIRHAVGTLGVVSAVLASTVVTGAASLPMLGSTPDIARSTASLPTLVGAEVARQCSRVFGAVAVCGGHLESLRPGGRLDVSVVGRGEVLGQLMKLEGESPTFTELVVRLDGGSGTGASEDVRRESIARAKAIDDVDFNPHSLAEPTAVLDEIVSFVADCPPPVPATTSGSTPAVTDLVFSKLRRRAIAVVRTFIQSGGSAFVSTLTAHPTLLPLVSRLSTATASSATPAAAVPAPVIPTAPVMLAESEARVLQLEGNTGGYDSTANNNPLAPLASEAGGLASLVNRTAGVSGSSAPDIREEDCVVPPAGAWAPITCVSADYLAISSTGNSMRAADTSARTIRRRNPQSGEYVTLCANILVKEGAWYYELHFLSAPNTPERTAVGWARPDRFRLDSSMGKAGSWGFDPIRQDRCGDGNRNSYGEYWKRVEKEVVGCWISIVGSRATLSFSLSGKVFGTAYNLDVPPLGTSGLGSFGPYVGFVPCVSTLDDAGVRFVFAEDEMKHFATARTAVPHIQPLFSRDESKAPAAALAAAAAAVPAGTPISGDLSEPPRMVMPPYPYALWNKSADSALAGSILPAPLSVPSPFRQTSTATSAVRTASCVDPIHLIHASALPTADGKEWTSIDTTAGSDFTAFSSAPAALNAAAAATEPAAPALPTLTAADATPFVDVSGRASTAGSSFSVALDVTCGLDVSKLGKPLAAVLAVGNWPEGEGTGFKLSIDPSFSEWTVTTRTPVPTAAAKAGVSAIADTSIPASPFAAPPTVMVAPGGISTASDTPALSFGSFGAGPNTGSESKADTTTATALATLMFANPPIATTATFTTKAFAREQSLLSFAGAQPASSGVDSKSAATLAPAAPQAAFFDYDFRSGELPLGARITGNGNSSFIAGSHTYVAAQSGLELVIDFDQLATSTPRSLRTPAAAASPNAAPASTWNQYTVHAVVKLLSLPPVSTSGQAAIFNLTPADGRESAVGVVNSSGWLGAVGYDAVNQYRIKQETWHVMTLVGEVGTVRDAAADPNSAPTSRVRLYVDGILVSAAAVPESAPARLLLKSKLALFSSPDPLKLMRGGCVQFVRVEKRAADETQIKSFCEGYKSVRQPPPPHQIVLTGSLEDIDPPAAAVDAKLELKSGADAEAGNAASPSKRWRLNVFVDGALAHSSTAPAAVASAGGPTLACWPPRIRCQAPLTGIVRNVTLWRLALTPAEVALLPKPASVLSPAPAPAIGGGSSNLLSLTDFKFEFSPFGGSDSKAPAPAQSSGMPSPSDADTSLYARVESDRLLEKKDDTLARHKLSSLLRHKSDQLMALRLEGVNGHAVIRSCPKLPIGNSSYTMECWVRAEANEKSFGLIAWGGWGKDYQSNGLVCNNTCIVNLWWSKNLSKHVTLIDDWHAVAVTYDNRTGVRSLYFDGIQVTTETITDVQCNSQYNDFFIGRYVENDGERTLKGHITEVRIWNVARTDTQIAQNMLRHIPEREAKSGGLVCYYAASQRLPPPPNPPAANVLAGFSSHVTLAPNAPRPLMFDLANSCHAELVGTARLVNLQAVGVLGTPNHVAGTGTISSTTAVDRGRRLLAPLRNMGFAPEWIDLAIEHLKRRERDSELKRAAAQRTKTGTGGGGKDSKSEFKLVAAGKSVANPNVSTTDDLPFGGNKMFPFTDSPQMYGMTNDDDSDAAAGNSMLNFNLLGSTTDDLDAELDGVSAGGGSGGVAGGAVAPGTTTPIRQFLDVGLVSLALRSEISDFVAANRDTLHSNLLLKRAIFELLPFGTGAGVPLSTCLDALAAQRLNVPAAITALMSLAPLGDVKSNSYRVLRAKLSSVAAACSIDEKAGPPRPALYNLKPRSAPPIMNPDGSVSTHSQWRLYESPSDLRAAAVVGAAADESAVGTSRRFCALPPANEKSIFKTANEFVDAVCAAEDRLAGQYARQCVLAILRSCALDTKTDAALALTAGTERKTPLPVAAADSKVPPAAAALVPITVSALQRAGRVFELLNKSTAAGGGAAPTPFLAQFIRSIVFGRDSVDIIELRSALLQFMLAEADQLETNSSATASPAGAGAAAPSAARLPVSSLVVSEAIVQLLLLTRTDAASTKAAVAVPYNAALELCVWLFSLIVDVIQQRAALSSTAVMTVRPTSSQQQHRTSQAQAQSAAQLQASAAQQKRLSIQLTRLLLPAPLIALCFNVLLRTALLEHSERAQLWLRVVGRIVQLPGVELLPDTGRQLYAMLERTFTGSQSSASEIAEKSDPVFRALLELQVILNKRRGATYDAKSGADSHVKAKEKSLFGESFVVPASTYEAFTNNYPFLAYAPPPNRDAPNPPFITVLRGGMGLQVRSKCSLLVSEPLIVDTSSDLVVECEISGCGDAGAHNWWIGMRVGPNTISIQLPLPATGNSSSAAASLLKVEGGDESTFAAPIPIGLKADSYYTFTVHWSRATGYTTVSVTPLPTTAEQKSAAAFNPPIPLITKSWRNRGGAGAIKNSSLIEANTVGLTVDGSGSPFGSHRALFRNFMVKSQIETVVEDGDPFTVLLRKLAEFEELCTFFRAAPASSAAAAAAIEKRDSKDSKADVKSPAPASAATSNPPTLSERVVRLICKDIGLPATPRADFLSAVATGTYASDLELVDCYNVLTERGNMSDAAFEQQTRRYKLLPELSRTVWRYRLGILVYFNRLLPDILPFCDLSLAATAAAGGASGAGTGGGAAAESSSWLVRSVHSVRGLIISRVKMAEWTRALSATVQSNMREQLIEFNLFQASSLFERKKTDFKLRFSLFGQLYQALSRKTARERAAMLRIARNSRAWKCSMQGLNAQDVGGPYRDILEKIMRELQSPVLPLFVPCANNRQNAGENRDKFVPRPLGADSALILSGFELVGQLMGLAIRSGNLLALNLPSIVWKHLCSDEVTVDDVRAVDLLSFQIVHEIDSHLAAHSNADAFDSAMSRSSGTGDRRFEVFGSDQRVYPLIPGGSSVRITYHNARHFCRALTRFRLTEFRPQCEAIRRGLSTVVPIALLSLWSWQELERAVCGSAYDLDTLQSSYTTYDGCKETDPFIQLFWKMLRDRFSDTERAQFFTFAWGRSRLPTTRESWGDTKFKISSYRGKYQGADTNKYLPIAHTCFFHIEIPAYTSLDIMTERMTYAMLNVDVIDGDSTHEHGTVRHEIGTAADDTQPSLWH